jgi:phage/plasmid-associated DNA primase
LQKQENHIKQFIDDRIIKADKQENFIRSKEIFSEYKEWCRPRGVTAIRTMNSFIDAFKIDVEEDSYTEDTKNFGINKIRIKNCFIGYQLKKEDQEDDEDDEDDPLNT